MDSKNIEEDEEHSMVSEEKVPIAVLISIETIDKLLLINYR